MTTQFRAASPTRWDAQRHGDRCHQCCARSSTNSVNSKAGYCTEKSAAALPGARTVRDTLGRGFKRGRARPTNQRIRAWKRGPGYAEYIACTLRKKSHPPSVMGNVLNLAPGVQALLFIVGNRSSRANGGCLLRQIWRALRNSCLNTAIWRCLCEPDDVAPQTYAESAKRCGLTGSAGMGSTRALHAIPNRCCRRRHRRGSPTPRFRRSFPRTAESDDDWMRERERTRSTLANRMRSIWRMESMRSKVQYAQCHEKNTTPYRMTSPVGSTIHLLF